MKTVTVAILTKNEEAHISSCIENAKQCTDKVLVIDSGSTDQTVSLAEAAGAIVQYRAWDDDFAAQRNFAHQFVDTDYILWLDADERMDEDLVKAVHDALSKEKEFVYQVKRKSIVMGKMLSHGVNRPDTIERMYPVDKGCWKNQVHERLHSELAFRLLPGVLLHYTYESWDQYWQKMNYYSTLWAENAYKKGKKASYTKAYVKAAFHWFVMMFIRGAFLDGKVGCLMCTMFYMYTVMKYVKLDYLNRGKV